MAHTVGDTAQGAMSVGLNLLISQGVRGLYGGRKCLEESPKL